MQNETQSGPKKKTNNIHLHNHKGPHHQVPYSGKLLREKLSWISRFYSHPWKFFPRNFRHATPILQSVYILLKFSLRNAPFLPIRKSFLPRKFLAIRYILCMTLCILPYPCVVDDGTTLHLLSLRPQPRHLSPDRHKLKLLRQIDTLPNLQERT